MELLMDFLIIEALSDSVNDEAVVLPSTTFYSSCLH
jgi:hypothetical protein